MAVALGLDIGGTQIKAALVDSSGSVLQSAKISTPLKLPALREALQSLIQGLAAGRDIVGAGVACKGVIDPSTTRIECQPGVMNYVEGCLLSELVCDALGATVPVYADNDARVALVGECVWGAARGKRDAILLTLGTGVGGGILSDGRILRGHRGIAGHLGHITVDPEGPPCICGNRGCLESVFSARVIEAEAYSALHRGLTSKFLGSSTGQPPSCIEVFAAAREGDPIAVWIVNSGMRKLGGAIAGLMHALDPEVVILGGQVASAGDALFMPLREEVAWRTRILLRREVPIIGTQVNDPSGVVGAAALVFESG
jgi:glucokinase